MSDLSQISETQVLYVDAGYDLDGKRRLLAITRKLSMRNIFEVTSVEPASAIGEHPGVAVLELIFPISVGMYRKMLAEREAGSLGLASAAFNVSMDAAIYTEPLEENVEDTSSARVQKRGMPKKPSP